jgi:FkbM family methyltransferase
MSKVPVIRRFLCQAKKYALPLRLRLALFFDRDPYIIEVGANDGKTGDPLYGLISRNNNFRALLIEPVPYLFSKLQEAYAGLDRCVLENVAIDSNASRKPIYFIDPSAESFVENLPPYFEELATFNKSNLIDLLGSKYVGFIREAIVEVCPLSYLISKHRISKVSILQIDTEGYDFEVLKTFPFELLRPRIICFEHCHLSEADRQAAIQFVKSYGFVVEKWGKDYICINHRSF